MAYRFFKCKCGNEFHGFIDSQEGWPAHICSKCGENAPMELNDPSANGTKLLFNYMEP